MVGLVDDLPEDAEQVLRRLHVEPGQRLVEEEDLRVAGQGTPHLDQAERRRAAAPPPAPWPPGSAAAARGARRPARSPPSTAEAASGDRTCPARAGARDTRARWARPGARARSGPGTARAAGTSGPGPGSARARGETFVTSSPCSHTRPALGRSRPDSTPRSVDLPAPLGPTRPAMRARLDLDGDVGERREPAEADGDARRPPGPSVRRRSAVALVDRRNGGRRHETLLRDLGAPSRPARGPPPTVRPVDELRVTAASGAEAQDQPPQLAAAARPGRRRGTWPPRWHRGRRAPAARWAHRHGREVVLRQRRREDERQPGDQRRGIRPHTDRDQHGQPDDAGEGGELARAGTSSAPGRAARRRCRR